MHVHVTADRRAVGSYGRAVPHMQLRATEIGSRSDAGSSHRDSSARSKRGLLLPGCVNVSFDGGSVEEQRAFGWRIQSGAIEVQAATEFCGHCANDAAGMEPVIAEDASSNLGTVKGEGGVVGV